MTNADLAGRRAVTASSLVGALLLAGGCASLSPPPADRPPALAAQAAWASGGGAVDRSARRAQPAAWFRTPLLDELMAEALQAAPDLRTARARLAESRARRALAEAQFSPSVSWSGSVARSDSGGSSISGGSARTVYDAGFDASWELDAFGRLGAGVRAAEADEQATAAALEDARVTLLAEVARRYGEIAVLQQRLVLAERSLQNQQALAEIAGWRTQSGLASSLDAAQSRTALEQARAQIPALQAALAQSRQSLAVLIGRTPDALDARLAPPLAWPDLPERPAVGVPAEALRQRADVRQAERQFLAEVARTDQARAAMLPRVSLSASLGWQALTLSALTGGQAAAASLAAQIGGTLFDGGRLRAQWQVQGAAQERAAVAYEQVALAALGDVEAAISAWQGARERGARLAEAAASAREAAELARIGYRSGLTDVTQVLETERSLQSIEDSLASSRGDAWAALIRLYKGLGGAWASAS